MLDWSTCPVVERDPEKVSGAWIFRETRVPVSALFENLESGATVEQFLEWFPGISRDHVNGVLEYAARSLSEAGSRVDKQVAEEEPAVVQPPMNTDKRG